MAAPCRRDPALRTIFMRPQPAPGKLEEGGIDLQHENMRMIVLMGQQDGLHCSPHALLSVPACSPSSNAACAH